jgi:hypothetical protein
MSENKLTQGIPTTEAHGFQEAGEAVNRQTTASAATDRAPEQRFFVPVQGAGWLSANFVAAEPLTAA